MFINNEFSSLLNEFNNNLNSHSYMFYTNDFFSCKKDLEELIRKIFNVENLELVKSNYYNILKSDNKSILKEEVDLIKSTFTKTSYISNKKIYLIDEAHKLNSSSANIILKFLEEPTDNVIAFFITTSLDTVLSTIKSRCQIITVMYSSNENLCDKDFKIIDNMFSGNKYINIFTYKKYIEKYTRDELIVLFNEYLNTCYNSIDIKSLNIIKKINNIISLLQKNVNIDYIIDYFFLESGNEYDSSSKV